MSLESTRETTYLSVPSLLLLGRFPFARHFQIVCLLIQLAFALDIITND